MGCDGEEVVAGRDSVGRAGLDLLAGAYLLV